MSFFNEVLHRKIDCCVTQTGHAASKCTFNLNTRNVLAFPPGILCGVTLSQLGEGQQRQKVLQG